MTREVVIRIATTDDCPAVCRLLRELDDHHIRIRPDVFQSFDGPTRPQEHLARFINEHDGDIFLAEVGADIVGLATIRIVDGPDGPMFRSSQSASMDNLIVTRDFQGLGIGKRLLDRAVTWSQSREIPSININVWIDNESGTSFFKASGFKPLCQRMELRIDSAQ